MSRSATSAICAFVRSSGGNVAVTFAIMSVPLMFAVGTAVDYSLATTTRSDMQNALDAASLAALQLPKSATLSDREATLDQVYAANGGLGTASLVGDVTVVNQIASLKSQATYEMQTVLMRLANRNQTRIGTTATVSKHEALTAARFQLLAVTGYWDKVVTLFGRQTGQTTYKPLISMKYVYNGLGGVGVGTTTLNKIEAGVTTPIYRINCSRVLVLSACTNEILRDDGTTEVDLENFDDTYLQMDISASTSDGIYWLNYNNPPRTIRSNDPNLANRLFVDQIQQPNGVAVDMQKAVGCGNWQEQRWEDGGGAGGQSAWNGTDFRYKVRGRCDWGNVKSVFITK